VHLVGFYYKNKFKCNFTTVPQIFHTVPTTVEKFISCGELFCSLLTEVPLLCYQPLHYNHFHSTVVKFLAAHLVTNSPCHNHNQCRCYTLCTILVNNQLDALFQCIYLFHFSTGFEQPSAHQQENRIVSIHHLRLRWSRDSVLAFGTQVPRRRVQTRPKPSDFFVGRKNPQHTFLRRGSKVVGPMS
jgi:hypothetical protein